MNFGIKSFVLSVSTMVGTIVGAGIFAIPYIISQSGVIPGLFYFLVLGTVVVLLHLMYGEVCLRTSEKHRIVGYAHKYLGIWGRVLASFSLLLVLGGTLLAYLVLAGQFLEIVLAPIFSAPDTVFSLIFLLMCGFFIAQGRQVITKAELVFNVGLISVVGFIVLLAVLHMDAGNFELIRVDKMFLPYGVIFFTLIGWEAIPEIAAFLKDTKSKVKLHHVIITATVLAATLSAVFAFSVVGVSGQATTQDAFSGLIPLLGQRIGMLGAFFGILAITSSFLVLGNYLKNSLRHDFNVPTKPAIAFALLLPLIPFLLGVREFTGIMTVLGSLMGVLEGLMIIKIFESAKAKGDRLPEYSLPISPALVKGMMGLLIGGGAAAVFL